MEKEEFPTFLNEQPTVVFGRTTRELLIILIGLTLSYLTWVALGSILPGSVLGVQVIQGICAAVPCLGALVVALGNFGSRRLEDWAAVAIFYSLTPKTYVYMPFEEDETEDEIVELYHYASTKAEIDEHDG